MRDNEAKKAYEYMRKSIAILVGAMLFLGVFFSDIFIAREYVHDCTGEECPICQTIAECEAFISRVSSFLVMIAAAFMVALCLCKAVDIFCEILLFETLISKKVRLNN